MNDIETFWRDRLVELLKWGTGIYLLVAGWSVTAHDKFELFENGEFAVAISESGKLAIGEGATRAVALFVFSIVFAVCWPISIKWIYQRHLSGSDVDATVLPRSMVLRYCHALSISLVLVSLAMGLQ